MSAHQRLLRLQKRITRGLQQEADRLVGPAPESIRRYEREFRRDFRGERFARASKADLIDAVRDADVTFVGDFHVLEQAQRTMLRLIRDATLAHEDWVIGLELASSRYQRALDEYVSGGMSAERLRAEIRYDAEWGFPWENYLPIIHLARERGFRVIALNQPRDLEALVTGAEGEEREHANLHSRDRWAAGVLTDALAAERPGAGGEPSRRRVKDRRAIVLYGDLHVASGHLPARLRQVSREYFGRALKSLIVHQNHDPLYWKLARAEPESLGKSQVLRLGAHAFCVLAVPPWVKLQAWVDWAEGHHSRADQLSGPSLEDEAEEEAEPAPDYLSLLGSYGSVIAEVLGVAPASCEEVQVFTVTQADDFLSRARQADMTRTEHRLARFHVLHNQRLYVPSDSLIYLGSPSLNALAEMAALHLFHERVERPASDRFYEPNPESFLRNVLQATFGFFGSLLVNPRRKCDLPEDHELRLRALETGAKPTYPHEAAARRLVLDFFQRAFEFQESAEDPDAEWVPESWVEALAARELAPAFLLGARAVGRILGRRLHAALLAEQVTPEEVVGIFRRPQPTAARLRALVAALSEAPRVGSSKSESI